MAKNHIVLVFVLILGCAPIAFADSTQTQPLYGFAWPTHSIPIMVKASQQYVRSPVLKAMNTWNLAQQWFIMTYMGGAGRPFVFYETNSTVDSMITITFNQTHTIEDLGVTHWHELHDQQ